MLVWLALLPAGIGALVGSLRVGGVPDGHPLLLLAGALFGTCIGACRSSSHAVLGAFFGAVLAWPVFMVVLILLLFCGLIDLD
jgi:hypothetical protein